MPFMASRVLMSTLQVAEHSGGQDCAAPIALDRRVNADDRARGDLLSRRFASVDTTALRDHAACMYTLTPDEHPMLEPSRGSTTCTSEPA